MLQDKNLFGLQIKDKLRNKRRRRKYESQSFKDSSEKKKNYLQDNINSLKSLHSLEREMKEIKNIIHNPPSLDPNFVEHTWKVDNKRIIEERNNKAIEKKIIDRIQQLDRRQDYLKGIPNFIKNGSVDYSMKAVFKPTNDEMWKFKEIPDAFVTTSDIMSEENTQSNKLPTLISSNNSSDIRNLIPQYSYWLNRIAKDSIATKFHEK